MAETHSPHDLQKFLDYTFEYPEILDEALTRRAYLNDQQKKEAVDMSPLATLGDAVLNAVIVHRLYEKGKRTKKELNDGKSEQGRRVKTRTFAAQHQLPEYIQWGKGEKKGEVDKNSEKALDTVTEALIGAIYLDAQKRGMNGMTVVNEILENKKFFS